MKFDTDILTPVELHNGVYLKRDDLFAPFGNDFITGGKIRQCISLIETNYDYIKNECNNTIATAASIHSPQAVIVARLAKEYGFNCVVGIGNTTVEKALERKTMSLCEEYGAEIVVLSETQGFNNVLYSNLEKLRQERPMFKVLFGYQVDDNRESILGKIADQVQNIPEEVTTLVVPLGSGVTFTGVLFGAMEFKLNKRIVAIQPFGYDRRKDVHKWLGVPMNSALSKHFDVSVCPEYEYHKGTYGYSNLLPYKVGEVELDEIYESKAYDMMVKEKLVDFDNEKVCFWIVGNANYVR